MRKLVIAGGLALAAGLGGLLAVASGLVFTRSQPAADATAPAAVKIVELVSQTYPLGQTTDALQAPLAGAASVMRLRQGAEVEVVGLVEGNGWYQIELPDKRLAYVPVAAIPAAASPPAAAAAAAPPLATAAPAAPSAAAPSAAAAVITSPPANSPPPQTATAEEGDAIDLPPAIEFDAASDQLSVIRPTPLFVAPNLGAPQEYTVEVGRKVEVIAKSKDGAWAWVTTADGKPAYISMSDLGPSP